MNQSQNKQQSLPPTSCEVLIIGAGVSGASSLHSLYKAGVKNIVIIECGQSGQGNNLGRRTSEHAYIRKDDINQTRNYNNARNSGSAVMNEPTQTIKMMVNVYPSSSQDFIAHHGVEGARRYLKLAYKGIQLQKDLAKYAFPTDNELKENLVQLGSLYVCEERDEEEFKEEFKLLKELGCVGVELWDKEKVWKHAGGHPTKFTLGIFFPQDSVINSQKYSANLIQYIISKENSIKLYENCPAAVKVKTVNGQAITKLENGQKIQSKYVVVCTGGLLLDKTIAGILNPCYSYLVSLKEPESTKKELCRLPYPNSLNFFTWNFTHDWCLTKGHLRCSGQDHFSALKPPRAEERCAELAKWTVEKLPYLKESELTCDKKYGVYSETTDKAPLVGTTTPSSKVCYVLGCNAWGQASLSYSASLVAGMLGYEKLNDEQKDCLKLLTIRRFALINEILQDAQSNQLRPKL